MKTTLAVSLAFAIPFVCPADDGYGPVGARHAPSSYKAPADLVPGGAFIDRILPIPLGSGARHGQWGGKNVQPRVVENGLEDPAWSYWCMSVHRETDGFYHMFATRWPEADPRGHNAWPESRVVHATSASPTGPFSFKQEVGPGHNVMCYRAKDGTYVLYVIGGAYTAQSVGGPWQKFDLRYDRRGMPEVPMSNHTFALREDGSVLMVSRGGHVWISEDGLKPFRKITCEGLYPKIPGEFEDPVIWRDEVQYHLIVNDRHGRTAFYLRSPDGVNWNWDEGKAYDIAAAPATPEGQGSGKDVSVLDLGARVRPLPAANRFGEEGWFVWCGAPVRGEDGKYHLFYSRWPVSVGFAPGWAIHSEIAYAVSDHPAGPYRHVNIALPRRGINPATGRKYWDADVTHNPNVLRHGEKYYLYYMGNHGDGKSYPMHRNNQRIGLAVSERPEGPWQRLDAPIVDVSPDRTAFDSLCVTNPAACVRPDGGAVLLYKAVQSIEGKEMGGNVRYGVAMAGRPEGPYVKQPGRIFEADKPGSHWMVAEDPFIWFSRRYGNRYYAPHPLVLLNEFGRIAYRLSSSGISHHKRSGWPW